VQAGQGLGFKVQPPETPLEPLPAVCPEYYHSLQKSTGLFAGKIIQAFAFRLFCNLCVIRRE
jgi:hypothetical protein